MRGMKQDFGAWQAIPDPPEDKRNPHAVALGKFC
jgi:hypothetical protein